MLDWLLSRHLSDRKGPVRYVQSQNGNLLGEFDRLRDDVYELDWANECFGNFFFYQISSLRKRYLQMQAISGLAMRRARQVFTWVFVVDERDS